MLLMVYRAVNADSPPEFSARTLVEVGRIAAQPCVVVAVRVPLGQFTGILLQVVVAEVRHWSVQEVAAPVGIVRSVGTIGCVHLTMIEAPFVFAAVRAWEGGYLG